MTYIASLPFGLTLPPAPVANDDENGSLSRPYERQPNRQTRQSLKKPVLYALSSSSYPMVHAAPIAREGNVANASFLTSEDVPEQDQLLPYLLDPPAEDMALVPVGDTSVVETHIQPRSGTRPNRNWAWYVVGTIGSVILCVSILLGILRRGTIKQTTTPPIDEKTPLLMAPEGTVTTAEKPTRSITIIEPEVPPIARKEDTAADDDATPVKKKSNRRRVRGRKKRRDSNAAILDKDGEGDDDDEDDRGDSSSSPPNTVRKKDDKPLPDLPREMSSTAIADVDDKERLSISDCIIGELCDSLTSWTADL